MFSNLTKFQKTVLALTAGFLAFFLVLGWAGDYDYCEQVILHMSQEQYDSVKNLLTDQTGFTPSDKDIAHWWVDHQDDVP